MEFPHVLNSKDEGSKQGSDDEVLTQEVADATMKKAKNLFEQKDYSAAAGAFSRVLTYLSEKHGEGAFECADALYLYGKALYHYVVVTAGTLGRSAYKYGLDQTVLEEPNTEHKGNQSNIEDPEVDEDYVFYKKQNNKNLNDETDSEDASSVDDDLDLAHQVLSMAINSYESKGSLCKKDSNLGDAYLYLGHTHLESERPAEAADCFKKGLDVKSTYLEEGHCELSELLYMYGVAHQALAKYDSSLEYIKKSRANMIKKLDEIKAIYSQESKAKEGVPRDENVCEERKEKMVRLKGEIARIEEEIAEVDSKIEDLNYTIEFTSRAQYEKLFKIPQLSGSSSQTQSGRKFNPPEGVKDISNLIRKKEAPKKN